LNKESNKFYLEPLAINESLARGATKRLERECIENINNLSIISNGFKNLQKKCKAIFKDGTVSGFYIGEKECLAMFVMFDQQKNMFAGAYLAKINGKYSLYDCDMRFSKHSIQRLIQRLKTKSPRIEVAKAIHAQTKYGLTREPRKVINIDEKWRAPGINDIDTAAPYIEDGHLLGMWFFAQKSDINCTFVGSSVAKTFVDEVKLREPQYSKCMELYHKENKATLCGEKMPNLDLLNANLASC